MPEIATTWRPRSAWAGSAKAGRLGRSTGEAGVRLTLRDHLGLATILVADGQEAALAEKIRETLRLDLPGLGRTLFTGTTGLVWSGPGQWLAVAEDRDAFAALPAALAGIASVTDQSDGRAVVRVSGRDARVALAKGVSLDLHPRAFHAGHAAVTSIAHIGAQLWQVSEAPVYDIAVARSFAGSFWSWLADSSAEFGCEVVA